MATRSSSAPPMSSRRPSADNSRMASPTNSGLPFVARHTAAATRPVGAVPAVAAITCATASASSPRSAITRTDGSRAISAIAGVNGCSGVSSTSR